MHWSGKLIRGRGDLSVYAKAKAESAAPVGAASSSRTDLGVR